MQKNSVFKLILGSKIILIPTFFPSITDISQDIYKSLQQNGQYQIKSDVCDYVLGSFIKNWIKKETPKITIDNYSQYQQLSQEFDLMKDLIKLYNYYSIKISILNLQNVKLQTQIIKKREKIKEITNNYQQIIKKLFINKIIITNDYNFQLIKDDLFSFCNANDIDAINELTSKKVTDYDSGLIFILNDEKKTATVYEDIGLFFDIEIPRTITHNSIEFIVTDIFNHSIVPISNSCDYDNKINSIKFAKNVKIRSFPLNFINDTIITSITLPESIEKLQLKDDFNAPHLSEIKVSPKNKNFIIFDNFFLIGKSYTKSDNFDVLYFVNRCIDFVVIPSFVKYVKESAFHENKKVISIEFSEDSELISISKNAFFRSSLKSLTLPSSVEKLESGWNEGLNNLKTIKVIKNKVNNITLFKGNFILGKMDLKSDIFDVLLLARKNIKEVFVPSFIKVISSYAFSDNITEKIEFSNDSELISIEKFAFAGSFIKSILIPSHVYKIRKSAFINTKLLNVKFSKKSNLEKIGRRAFSECHYLEKVECEKITNSINTTILIKKCAFENCHELKDVGFLNNYKSVIIEERAFSNTKMKQNKDENIEYLNENFEGYNYHIKNAYFINLVENIITYSFSDIKELTIPSSVNRVPAHSFSYHGIEKVKILDHVKTIDQYAFYESNLKIIEFSEKSELIYIGNNSFSKSNIKNIVIPSHVKKIGHKAFFITQLEHISIPDSVSFIGDKCFSNSNLKTIQFSDKSKIKTIGRHLFEYTQLENIMIPSSISSFDGSFYFNDETEKQFTITILQNEIQNISYYDNSFIIGKSNLNYNFYDTLVFADKDVETPIIPPFIKRISSYAFNGCHKLKTIIIPDDSELNEICPFAFENSSLESIYIPPKNIKIHQYAFSYCNNLKNVEFSNDTNSLIIEENIFAFSSVEKITIPSDTIFKDRWCCGIDEIKDIKIIEKRNSRIKLYENQILLSKSDKNNDEYENLVCAICDFDSLTIPPFITKISPFAFSLCSRLVDFKFCEESKIRKIGKDTFHFSPIESVYISSNIIKICCNAFCCCEKLKKVEFSKKSKLKIIDNNAFSYTALESIFIPNSVTDIKNNVFKNTKNLKVIDFNDKSELRYIGQFAFFNTEICAFSIPKSVEYIDSSTFNNCKCIKIIEIQEYSSLKFLSFNDFFEEMIVMVATNVNIIPVINFENN